MKLKDFIAPPLKWWWLILLSAGIAALASYLIVRPQPPMYNARTTLLVGNAISQPNPTGNEINLAMQLAQAYAGYASREPVKAATMKALGLLDLPNFTAQALPNSPWVEINVTDTDPERAQLVANELANQLILQSPTNAPKEERTRQEFIGQELDRLQTEIIKTRRGIEEKQQFLSSMTSAVQISDLQTQIEALDTKLNLLQTNYATLLASTQQGALNTLSIFEPAALPTQPVGVSKILIVLIASACGLALAVGAAYLIEFIDHSLKTTEQVMSVCGLSVLGAISNIGKDGWAFVARNPRSPVAEAFRSLRTNLEFASVDEPLKTILVTSVDAGDGKTIVATNLAFSLAQTEEKKVLLLDCDLRIPNIHRVLDLAESPGLSDAFRERQSILDVIQRCEDQKLDVITSGPLPPNPVELLSSKRMKSILAELEEEYDIIIVDGPPAMVTDALILASQVSGVVMVARYGYTSEGSARQMVEQIQKVGARMLGVVMNRVPHRSAEARRFYASGYYYRAENAPVKNVNAPGG